MTDSTNKTAEQLISLDTEQHPVSALDACLIALASINHDFLTGEPIASIQSGQIKPDEKGHYIKAAVNWFKDWMQQNGHGQEFENKQLGTVIIAPSGIKAAMSHKPHPIDVQALPALPLIIEKAVVLSRTLDDMGKPLENIVVAAPIEIDAKKYYMVVRLRRHTEDKNDKPRFYTQAVTIVEDIKKGHIPSDQVTGQNTLLTQNGGRVRLLNVLHAALRVNVPTLNVVTGRSSTVKTPKGTKLDTVFALVEADDVIASHDATGGTNPKFPQELQPRDRSREASQAWVQKTAANLDPDSLGKTSRADTVAPIVGDDLIVESGNGRTMAIQLAYARDTANEYRDWLLEEAEYFGFKPEQVEAFKQPVLVRIRKTAIDRAAFAVEANQDDKLSLSATERAKADARRIDSNMAMLFNPSEDGDLLASSNTKFIQAFLTSIGDTETAQYIGTDGKPTQALVARIKAAVFSKAYRDDRLLEMVADQTKPDLKNMLNALSVAAPKFIEAQAINRVKAEDLSSQIVDGIESATDQKVIDAIIAAANVVMTAKNDNQDVSEFVKQQGLFGDLPDGVAELAVFLSKNAGSAKKMSLLFKAMASYLEKQAIDQSNNSLFGEPEPVSMRDVIAFAAGVIEREYGDKANLSMFDALLTFEDLARHYHIQTDIDRQAHEAATSPYNDLPEPTDEQKLSGDYVKGKLSIAGVDIAIENPAGSIRSGVDANGKAWQSTMQHHYGYIENTIGADGDELDVFVKTGLNEYTGIVYVIRQVNPDNWSFDEHKIIIGASTLEEAQQIYLSNYEEGWAGMGSIEALSIEDFKSNLGKTWNLFDSIGADLFTDQLNQLDVDADPIGALEICLQILNTDQVMGEFSDNHNDENYRYKDVGYIPNSRKELAQSSILQAKKNGNQLCVTDIDWDGLESEPRIAESLINKENVFGKVDWWGLKEQGMNGNVAYLLKRLYTAVDKQPIDNTAEARRLYVTGIQNLRNMMERAKNYDDVRIATIALSQLLKPSLNIITDESGVKDVSYDCKVMLALGKKLHSWIFKSGNKALHECRKMATDDWAWLEGKPQDDGKPKTTRKERFQLEVASEIQRVGGQPVSIESTEQFKDLFGLAAVQSGKWVLSDAESAAWHINNAAASFMDMSDITGIPVEQLGFGGRLGMAFGARGHGGALAHYEPDTRAINITKMRGGGSLGHEYFHFLDNVINEVMGQANVSIGSFGTRQPEALPDGSVRNAFEQLKKAMLDGTESLMRSYSYGEPEIKWAKRNMESSYGSMVHHVKAADNLKDAAQAIDQAYRVKNGAKRPKNADSWIKIAAIYFNQYQGTEAMIPTTLRGSNFYIQALELDQYKVDSYWSSSHEMAARSFSAYLQDRLSEQQRQNDYLAYSTQGGNSRVGEVAYPQGEERQRVNAAFDAVFKALRDEDVFGKAMGNQALMDSIFGLDDEGLELLYLN